MSKTNPKGIIKFDLSNHVLNNKQSENSDIIKTAADQFGQFYQLYGPTEKRICPKLKGKNVGDVVSEYICRHHCLDGVVIDDNKTICGEAIWRANAMDKFSREYVDEDGNIVGGYLNKRFEINRNVPEENKMRLKPGEIRKPRPASMGNLESRMQDMRSKEAEKRGYKPDTNTGDPFVWDKDVDQNNVEISQKERDRREESMGHKLVQYTNKDKQENNPKKAFNLKQYKTSQMTGPRGPYGPDNPSSDDLGLSPDYNPRDESDNEPINKNEDEEKVDLIYSDMSNYVKDYVEKYFLNNQDRKSFIDSLYALLVNNFVEYSSFTPDHKQKYQISPYDWDEVINSFNNYLNEKNIEPLSDEENKILSLAFDISPPIKTPRIQGYAHNDGKFNLNKYKQAQSDLRYEGIADGGVPYTDEEMGMSKKDIPPNVVEISAKEIPNLPNIYDSIFGNKSNPKFYQYFKNKIDSISEDQLVKVEVKSVTPEKFIFIFNPPTNGSNVEAMLLHLLAELSIQIPTTASQNKFNLKSFKEAKKKKGTTYEGVHYKVNPWAVCHTTVDKDKDPEKYERCVQDVKEKSKDMDSKGLDSKKKR